MKQTPLTSKKLFKDGRLKLLACDTALTFTSDTVTPFLGHCLKTYEKQNATWKQKKEL